MSFNPGLDSGQELTNEQVCTLFKCSLMGGMNKSNATNTLVLISNHVKSMYQDRIEGGIIHYTGEGQFGDQDLIKQNKTLYESNSNSVNVFLFEVYKPGAYTYQGQVKLAAAPYQEVQLDKNKKDRKVWMFPLRLVGDAQFTPIPIEQAKIIDEARSRLIHKMALGELMHRAMQTPRRPGKRQGITSQYQRNEYVVELALRRASGNCELCCNPAPFKNKKGRPYLEVHHIIWLAKGGEDVIENTVALCPNCHRKMHSLNLAEDLQSLHAKIG